MQGVEPSHHCQRPHQNDRSPLHPPLPLPVFTVLWFVFDCRGEGGSVRLVWSPRPPSHLHSIVPRRCLRGGRQDVQTNQEIKVSSRSKMRCYSLVTFSTATGLTSQTHARPGLGHRRICAAASSLHTGIIVSAFADKRRGAGNGLKTGSAGHIRLCTVEPLKLTVIELKVKV